MQGNYSGKIEPYFLAIATDKKQGFLASIIKFILYLLSLFYGLVIRTFIFYHGFWPYQAGCRVISVGNITLGGTGKTSLVEYIAKYLKSQGHKVAVLSRGYKRKITSYELRVTSYENMGDEPYMLSRNLKDIPVIVNKDRVEAIKKAVADFGVDTVILDDGFQQ